VQPPRQELAGPLPDTLQNQEREIIETALAESKGSRRPRRCGQAKLGIPRSTLDWKIKQDEDQETQVYLGVVVIPFFSIPENPALAEVSSSYGCV
jgi:DNA-binding NtrC family response regulator